MQMLLQVNSTDKLKLCISKCQERRARADIYSSNSTGPDHTALKNISIFNKYELYMWKICHKGHCSASGGLPRDAEQ